MIRYGHVLGSCRQHKHSMATHAFIADPTEWPSLQRSENSCCFLCPFFYMKCIKPIILLSSPQNLALLSRSLSLSLSHSLYHFPIPLSHTISQYHSIFCPSFHLYSLHSFSSPCLYEYPLFHYSSHFPLSINSHSFSLSSCRLSFFFSLLSIRVSIILCLRSSGEIVLYPIRSKCRLTHI